MNATQCVQCRKDGTYPSDKGLLCRDCYECSLFDPQLSNCKHQCEELVVVGKSGPFNLVKRALVHGGSNK